ncbi:MAG TPA: FAD:protein FMN transferase [Solirubrobacteraceae bacterium]|nr:FAD:protein FMN transferase [Solirubrobacteraceae bacterium]
MSPATRSWEALGTTALVRVEDPARLDAAAELVAAELARIDAAASRFRPDSELEQVNAAAGRFTRIGPLLYEAIAVALRAAALTDGAVDPTLGQALRLAGYSRDYAELEHPAGDEPPSTERRRVLTATRAPGWTEVRLTADPPGVALPAGVRLDLGATAKALAADRAAAQVAAEIDGAALVALGGDIAVAGPAPAGGWLIHVTDDHRSTPDAPGQTVAIAAGGLATSSTTTRRWRHEGEVMHHILDPATGAPADGPWRTVSVSAASCVDANIASTAAIVLGHGASGWLNERGLAARLVGRDGDVHVLGGWPEDQCP